MIGGDQVAVRYERGFLVPVGAEELDVVVAISRPIDTDFILFGHVDPPAATADETQRQLEVNGWTVRRLRVIEPKD